jgi:hypothetical protein
MSKNLPQIDLVCELQNPKEQFNQKELDKKNKKMRHLNRLKKLKEQEAHSKLKQAQSQESQNRYLVEMMI